MLLDCHGPSRGRSGGGLGGARVAPEGPKESQQGRSIGEERLSGDILWPLGLSRGARVAKRHPKEFQIDAKMDPKKPTYFYDQLIFVFGRELQLSHDLQQTNIDFRS